MTGERVLLAGERVLLRPLEAADRPRIREIVEEPEVGRWWWGSNGPEEVVEQLYSPDSEVVLAIVVDGSVAGCVQYAEEPTADYRHASIDIFVSSALHGHGIGRDAIRTVARHLFEARGHHRLTIDPAAANERAIRAYRAVGFREVGVMRQYERGPDGTYHDGLLMEMMRDELR